MLRRRMFALSIAVAIAGACELAHADDAAPSTQPAAPAYTLDVDSDAPDVVSYDSLAARVSSDLGAPVQRPGSTPPARAELVVRYRDADRALTVRATHAGGRVLERSVRAEGDAAAVQREAVLLAGNLARDEAQELLDALAARAPKEPAPVPSEPPLPPPKPPKPSPAANPDGSFPVVFAFVYPLATNLGRPRIDTNLSVSLAYGRVGSVRGVDLGSGVAHASGSVHGAQIAAVAAISTAVDGGQLAPVNVADDVRGVQLGVVNVARRVRGAQLGVVNIADEVDGGAVGLVSIHRDAIHPIAWGSNLSYTNAGIKFASKWAYTIVGVQYGTLETGLEPRFGTVAALGTTVPVASGFEIGGESAFSNVDPGAPDPRAANIWFHQRAILGWRFASHFRVFAGGGFRSPIAVDVGKSVFRPEFLGGLEF